MGRREALLLAGGRFEDAQLSQLRSPARDVDALEAVLADPQIGDFATRSLVDCTARTITRAVEEFFASRSLDDLLLCYVSSHGVKDRDGRLYFAATDTEKDWLASTAVSAAFVADQMERCRARAIVLLLDCCYSGAFLPRTKGDRDVHVKEQLEGQGRVILTASTALEYSWEGEQLSGEGEPSVFTAAVVEGLRTGAADRDGDGKVSVDDLAKHVYEQVRASGARQTPLRWAMGMASDVVVAMVPGTVVAVEVPEPVDVDALLTVLATEGPQPPDRLLEQVARLDAAGRDRLVDRLLTPGTADQRAAGLAVVRLPRLLAGHVASRLGDASSSATQSVWDTLAAHGAVAVPALLELLDTVPVAHRAAVSEALLAIGTTAAVFGLAERRQLPVDYLVGLARGPAAH